MDITCSRISERAMVFGSEVIMALAITHGLEKHW